MDTFVPIGGEPHARRHISQHLSSSRRDGRIAQCVWAFVAWHRHSLAQKGATWNA